MENTLTFIPATTVGNCTAGTTYKRVICSQGGCTFDKAEPDANKVLQYTGTGTPLAANSQDITKTDKVLLFLSTGSTGTGGSAFLRPTTAGSTNGLKLTGAFTVSASGSSGTFVANFNGALDGSQSPCDLGPPQFSFR
jgi:hypothetical protein